jgi:hypothetical protein
MSGERQTKLISGTYFFGIGMQIAFVPPMHANLQCSSTTDPSSISWNAETLGHHEVPVGPWQLDIRYAS